MRKRSKYRPKPVIANPIEFVITGNNPIATHDTYLVDLKLVNHNAVTCVLRGEATKSHINSLIAMHNICEAIRRMIKHRKITDLPIELDAATLIFGKAALLDLASRGASTGQWICTQPEIQALNDLMQMHDEMMELITVRHFEMAIAFANNEVACNRTTVINDYVVQHA
jgi:hypothetical protein